MYASTYRCMAQGLIPSDGQEALATERGGVTMLNHPADIDWLLEKCFAIQGADQSSNFSA